MNKPPWIALALFWTAGSVPCLPQQLLHHWYGETVTEGYGDELALVGDLDGDGIDDYLVGTQRREGLSRVHLRSGSNGVLIAEIEGTEPNGWFGASVAAFGDLDGDQVIDLAVGAPYSDTVWFFSGSTRASLGSIEAGSSSFGFFGFALANAGDVDADGRTDLLIGAPYTQGAAPITGRTVVVSGADASVLREHFGTLSYEQCGTSVGAFSDLDGDGYADYLVGSPGFNDPSGRQGAVRLYSGKDGSLLREVFGGSFADDYLGISIAGLGDVDGDSVDDYAAGAWQPWLEGPGAGYARVFSGATGAVLYTFPGENGVEGFGGEIARTGDLDSDGYNEIAVGVLYWARAGGPGMTNVYSGADGSLLMHLKDSDRTRLGTAVIGGEDLNSDQVPDLLIGTPDGYIEGPVDRQVRAFSGADGSVLYAIDSDSRYVQRFGVGFSACAAGDVDGDTVPDFAIGNQYEYNSSGGACLFSGASGARITCGVATDVGFSVEVLDDIDGDGVADFVSGGPDADLPSTNCGVVVALSGSTGSEIWRKSGATSDQLGWSLEVFRDFDGDGVGDLLVGAPQRPAKGLGYVLLLSGVDGSALHQISGTNLASGISVAVLGDVNRDGVEDFAIGALERVKIYSGADLSFLRAIVSDQNTSYFGYAVAPAGDVNQDGRADVLIGAPFYDSTAVDAGKVVIYSGRNGGFLFEHAGDAVRDLFGWSVHGGVDVDGDGFQDYAAGAPEATAGSYSQIGFARLYCGATHRLLHEIRGGPFNADHLGHTIRLVEDVDGDQRGEVLIGAPRDGFAGDKTGSAFLHAGDDLFLQVAPEIAWEGVQVDVDSRGAANASPTALFLVALNELPVTQLLDFKIADADGHARFGGTITADLVGFDFTLRSFALDPQAHVIDSGDADLLVR